MIHVVFKEIDIIGTVADDFYRQPIFGGIKETGSPVRRQIKELVFIQVMLFIGYEHAVLFHFLNRRISWKDFGKKRG